VMCAADACWDAMLEMARHGNAASKSDLEVGARALEMGLWGAWRNVRTNLAELEDAELKRRAAEAEAMATRAREKLSEVLTLLDRR